MRLKKKKKKDKEKGKRTREKFDKQCGLIQRKISAARSHGHVWEDLCFLCPVWQRYRARLEIGHLPDEIEDLRQLLSPKRTDEGKKESGCEGRDKKRAITEKLR